MKYASLIVSAALAGLIVASTAAKASVISLECAFSPSLTGVSPYSVQSNGSPNTPGYAKGVHVWVDTSSGKGYWQWKDFQEYQNGVLQTIDAGQINSLGGNFVHISRDSLKIQITTGSVLWVNRINGTLEYDIFAINPQTIVMFTCVRSDQPLPPTKF